jgi:hypothetical protein
MRDFDLRELEAVLLGQNVEYGNGLAAIRRAVIQHHDLLALQR